MPKLKEFINKKIESGSHYSASEVIRDGLILLEEQDQLKRIRLENLRGEIQKGIDDVKAGRFTKYNSAEELI